MEQPDLKQVPIWDADTASRSITHYAVIFLKCPYFLSCLPPRGENLRNRERSSPMLQVMQQSPCWGLVFTTLVQLTPNPLLCRGTVCLLGEGQVGSSTVSRRASPRHEKGQAHPRSCLSLRDLETSRHFQVDLGTLAYKMLSIKLFRGFDESALLKWKVEILTLQGTDR